MEPLIDGMSLHGSGMAGVFVDANQFLAKQRPPKTPNAKISGFECKWVAMDRHAGSRLSGRFGPKFSRGIRKIASVLTRNLASS